MPRNRLGEVRRSLVLMNYGPGAVIDFRVPGSGAAVSVVSAGLEAWDDRAVARGLSHDQTIYEPRLQKKLGVDGFRLPPVADDEDAGTDVLLGVQFPTWLQCPSCNRLQRFRHWASEPGDPGRYCAECSAGLPARRKVWVVPVRFVTACPEGHLEDFPWDWWVQHRDACSNRGRGKLKLEARGAGLAGLWLFCPGCEAGRSLEHIFRKAALVGIRCTGGRPWLANGDKECSHTPVTLQRGASNLYFPRLVSSIDIPPWSDAIQKRLGQFWAPIQNLEGGPPERARFIEQIWGVLGIRDKTAAEVARAIEQRLSVLAAPERMNLRWDEYEQFSSAGAESPRDEDFELRRESVPDAIKPWLADLVRVVRLREVRALTGFTRIQPNPGKLEGNGDGAETRVAPLSASPKNWLPAIDVRGEGIFIALDSARLREWEAHPGVMSRVASIVPLLKSSRALFDKDKEQLTPGLAARFLLIHSLAHVVMRQLSLQSGYSAASLRERLFVGDQPGRSAGILIYTASPDADGTLGGLQRQGEAPRFVRTFCQAVDSVRWCSSDPLCIEGVSAATEPSNLAACHSCVLASETSCEEFNTFLDRALLIGTPEEPGLGFFSTLPAVAGDDGGSSGQ